MGKRLCQDPIVWYETWLLESQIGSMDHGVGFIRHCTLKLQLTSFYSMVLPKFLSIGIKAFKHVSKPQMSGADGGTSIVVFAQDQSKGPCTARQRGCAV